MILKNKLVIYFSIFTFCLDLAIKHTQKVAYTINTNYLFGLVKLSDLVIIVLLFFIVYFLIKKELRKNWLIFLPIFLGGISNLIDRVFYGGVIDYFNFEIWGFFLAFNLADIMIVIGVVIYALAFFRHIKR